MAIRQARAADMPAVRTLVDRYGLTGEWPEKPDWIDHLLAQDGLWFDERDGRAAGFAGVLVDGGFTHLTDLFVDPDALGRGIGKALLAAAFPHDGARTTFASNDPRALPLYARAGLRPLAPLLYLRGAPRTSDNAAERIAVEAVPAGRPAALAFLASAGAYGLRAGEGRAVVRVVPGGAMLGPAVAGAADLVTLAGAVAAEHGEVKLALPGPHPALQPLLEAGLRIVDADTYMASAPGLDDLERRVPHADLG
jgi:GNAT superfamily N-acetyltransferase